MHQKSTIIGLLGILGIWLTAGLALPFVNILTMFSPGQLMAFRGLITAVIALAILRGDVFHVDNYTRLVGVTVPFATLGLFEGIRYWGAGPTIIVITATPVMNVIIGWFSGRRISSALVVSFTLVAVGIVMASHRGGFQWIGFAWSVFATIMSSLIYECFVRAKSKPLQKCFWGSLGMGTLGLLLGFGDSWMPIAQPNVLILVVSFAFVGGYLYWVANLVAFENLPTTEASVLAQGETISVIIGAGVFLGERLTSMQWLGVGIALVGAGFLSYALSIQAKPKKA